MKNLKFIDRFFIVSIIAISIMLSILYFSKKNQINNIDTTPTLIQTGTVSSGSSNYRVQEDELVNETGSTETGDTITHCNISVLSGLSYIDIFTEPFITPQKINYLGYTKEIEIIGNIEKAYLCIVSDIREDYTGPFKYYYSTYLWVGDEANAGHINVGYSLEKKLVYDNSSDSYSPFLNGKFWGHEAPFEYILDLDSVIISDMDNGGYKEIYPINIINNNQKLRIGGFVNSYPHYRAGKITKFRLYYEGGEIRLLE